MKIARVERDDGTEKTLINYMATPNIENPDGTQSMGPYTLMELPDMCFDRYENELAEELDSNVIYVPRVPFDMQLETESRGKDCTVYAQNIPFSKRDYEWFIDAINDLKVE